MAFGSPQDVEVLQGGAWVPGAMLGWRHDETGGCEAWVQLRADVPGVVEGAGTWVGLADVRLPERHLSLAPTPATAAMPAVGAPAAAVRPRRSRRHGADGTAEQPAVGAGLAGRHRAPAGIVPGRHRAATTEMPAIALTSATVASATVASAADGTPDEAVEEGAGAAPDTTVVAPAAVAPAVGGPSPSAPVAGDHDMLTRPIRLGDLAPSARSGRPPVRPSA